MPVSRGDVILTFVPNVGSPGGTVRPALVVQSDHNNARLNETIIAAITSNTSRAREATQLLIEVAAPDGATSGLLYDSVLGTQKVSDEKRCQEPFQRGLCHFLPRRTRPDTFSGR